MSRETEIIDIVTKKFATQLWNEQHLTIADEIFTSDFRTEAIPPEPQAWQGQGPESMKAHIRHWWQSVPNLHMYIDEITANGDCVVYNWRFTGFMSGAFFGIPPIGKEITAVGFTISYFEGEKINLNKTCWDKLHFLQQLQILPSLPEIVAAHQNQVGQS